MSNLKITEVKELATKEIKKLLEGEIESLEIDGISGNTLELVLESLGCTINEDLDINGWQCDYWFTFSHEDKTYTASGCAWHGTVTLSKE